MLHEKTQAHKVRHCRIPLMWNNRIDRPPETARPVVGARGWEEGAVGVTASWVQGLTWG